MGQLMFDAPLRRLTALISSCHDTGMLSASDGGNGGQFAPGPPSSAELVHHSHPSLLSLGSSFRCIVDFKSACFFFSEHNHTTCGKNCDWNAGGNYIPSANYRGQLEGHFVTDGVCACGCNYTCTIQLFYQKAHVEWC